jgi:rhamnosyltransferase
MQIESKIGGVVVLFNPNETVIENIKKWISHVNEICIIDNSPQAWAGLKHIQDLNPKVKYIHLPENVGIAKALNMGFATLNSCHVDWVLTMDQDTSCPSNMILDLLNEMKSYPSHETIGLISPYHITPATPHFDTKAISPIEVNQCMTSGNIVRTSLWKELNGFNENLFIDCVDHDFCHRAQSKGYRILQSQKIFVTHHLGNMKKVTFLGREYFTSGHNALRRYYMTRNRLFMLHHLHSTQDKWTIIKDIIREAFLILIFEDQKTNKSYHQLLGLTHFVFKKFGKLS